MINYPVNYYFTPEREWVHFINDDTANIRLTELAERELEPIKSIEIYTIGEPLRKNQVFGRMKNDIILCKLVRPFDGIIAEANSDYF